MSKSSENTNTIDAVDDRGWTALHRAARDGDVLEVERLLAAGANVDARTTAYVLGVARDSTPLIVTKYKHFDVMRLLLDSGANIDACHDDGYGNENTSMRSNNAPRSWTPLYYAVEHGPLKNVDYLIWKGASVNNTDTEG